MATLRSIEGEVELSLRLIDRTFDPFQLDLEWFEYELSIKLLRRQADRDAHLPLVEHHSGKGKINTKDLAALLRDLDALLETGDPLRFEPYDLNFYFEWSRETPRIFLIVTWFDLGLSPRSHAHRFPSAHTGFRFLTEEGSISQFREAVEEEFGPCSKPAGGVPSGFVN
jgi:hypothetical protein